MKFQAILDKYRKISFSERDKGARFERLIQAYLKTDPKWDSKFKKVWLWDEFPGRVDMGGGDTGIDIVALTYEGDYWAIQCKCFQENTRMDKPAVDSFLSTSSREFKNEEHRTSSFAQRLWISTSNNWGKNAQEALKNQKPPVARINLFDLAEAPVDWDKLEKGVHGEIARTPKKTLHNHQRDAVAKAHDYFTDQDRGKLIMACGTGKTFTALRIAERETNSDGLVLFLVPSIALLGQTLREWSGDALTPIKPVAICSDPEITRQRNRNEDTDAFSVIDLAFPASTDRDVVLDQFKKIKKADRPGMTVVFSTYQSIDVIASAQEKLLESGFPEFDLIICDEAHRTTGVSLAGEDESAFTKVHDSEFIKAKKRLYMTATPRLYDDTSKSKAAEADALIASMDDPSLYGTEIYRIGFGEAVKRGLLTDYKVLVLSLSDQDVPPPVQRLLSGQEHEINSDDVSKIIGTINALSKQFIGDQGITKENDPKPMQRAVAFCPNIQASKEISSLYNTASQIYLEQLPEDNRKTMVTTSSKHMDGTMSAPERDQMLSWLKEEKSGNECRIITNVRVLSEGVDVPSLDSVLFLSARNSQVDVVQSVGRVMRKAPGKNYGYIVIPVIIPADVEAEEALNDNERYKVVWTVLNALRAHDDRFNAIVNKIELNRKKPDNILIGRPEVSYDANGDPISAFETPEDYPSKDNIAKQLSIQFEQLQSVVYARMVKKVGDRRYWEQWAKDVAEIADRQMERIEYLIKNRPSQAKAFDNFLDGLQKNINPSISKDQAVEMLAQHIITKPIFEALFEDYSFEKNNAVSVAMQKMLTQLEGKSVAEESDKLQKFYESVRMRAEGIDNAEGKQRIIIELYDKFFKTAFPKMVEQLGIVYTPVEVVDFIIHSVNDVLKQEFGRSISDENIHVLDPFTGTGTFITRLLQSGLINQSDLLRKYKHELHANEIVLLAYYIAAVNIENAFHDRIKEQADDSSGAPYESFEGIVLTDTFQLGETDKSQELFSEMFPQNSERVDRQKKAPVRVIMGNPPYSIGQKAANDNAQNQKYEKLDSDIAKTYAKFSSAGLNKSLYDAYIKAFRWSTDRLDPKNGGVIGFVTNGKWLDANSTDGFRKVIEQEFSSIYVFDLRGDQRGDWRKEGGKIFGEGSQNRIAVTFLVKKPNSTGKASIYYHNIGDYLTRGEKLNTISEFLSISNKEMSWRLIQPNKHGDWLKQRDETFETFIPMAPDKKFDLQNQSYFNSYAIGVATNRDAWVYNFSEEAVGSNMKRTIDFYNQQKIDFEKAKAVNADINAERIIDTNPKSISWTVNLKKYLKKGIDLNYQEKEITSALYRPFIKQKLYFDKAFIERPGLWDQLYPTSTAVNFVIGVSGVGHQKIFSPIMSSSISDLQIVDKGQFFPLYYYEERHRNSPSLFDGEGETEYIRRDGVSDFILERAKKIYGKNVGKEDIFYYVYGILHSPDYRTTFANDLKMMLPRIPLLENVRDFWKFSKAGRNLAELHINYENVPPYDGVEVSGDESEYYRVEKMRFAKMDGVVRGKKRKVKDKSTIYYNSKITVSNIPEKAYEYIVNGKSAIEWIMDRYRVKTDKKSGITNDANDWAEEVGNPRYILDLLLSIINVSVQTVDIVDSLPEIDFVQQ